MKTLYDAIEQRGAELVTLYENRDNKTGPPPILQIPTGLQTLDDYGLLTPGILTLIVMHPGDGKTSVVMQLLEGATLAGFTPFVWAPEDPLNMVADRAIAKTINESAYKLRLLKLGSGIPARLNAAVVELDWARQVIVEDRKMSAPEFIEILEGLGPETGLAVGDYLQVFDNGDGDNLERTIAGVAWGMSDWSKRTGNASVAMSQPKPAVAERGRRSFDSWLWNKKKNAEDVNPEPLAVEGYRPMDGDANNCTAAYQRAKDFISGFRPGRWLNQHGFGVKDDVMEFVRTKGNYSPGQYPVRVGWQGETTRLYDKELNAKNRKK